MADQPNAPNLTLVREVNVLPMGMSGEPYTPRVYLKWHRADGSCPEGKAIADRSRGYYRADISSVSDWPVFYQIGRGCHCLEVASIVAPKRGKA